MNGGKRLPKNKRVDDLNNFFVKLETDFLNDRTYEKYNEIIVKINNLFDLILSTIKNNLIKKNQINNILDNNKQILDNFLEHKDNTGFVNRYNFIKGQFLKLIELYKDTVNNFNEKFDTTVENLNAEEIINKFENNIDSFDEKIDGLDSVFDDIVSLYEEKENIKTLLKNKQTEFDLFKENSIEKNILIEVINSYDLLYDELEKYLNINFLKTNKDLKIKELVKNIKSTNGQIFISLAKLTKLKEIQNNYNILKKI